MTEKICGVCMHPRRYHSVLGCGEEVNGKKCFCNKVFMDKPAFVAPTAIGALVSISEVIGALHSANMKAGEVDAYVQEVLPLLRNCIQDLAECISLNAAVLGDAQAENINTALALFQQAQNRMNNVIAELEEVDTAIRGAQENNSIYIERLAG